MTCILLNRKGEQCCPYHSIQHMDAAMEAQTTSPLIRGPYILAKPVPLSVAYIIYTAPICKFVG